jgi:hypothetical protein
MRNRPLGERRFRAAAHGDDDGDQEDRHHGHGAKADEP